MKSTGKMIRALLVGGLLLAFALVGQAGAQTWIQLTPTGTPPAARYRHSAVYDPTSNRMIVFGGQAPTSGCGLNPLNDTWVLTNANGLGGTPAWLQLAPSGTLPAARGGHGAGYDAVNDRMIVFGGDSTGCVPSTFNDVWVLIGASGTPGTPSWTKLTTSGATPPGLVKPAVTYDSVNNKLIVFGGNASEGNCGFENNDVWTLSYANGLGGSAVWTKLSPSGTRPIARWYHSAVYDSGADRLIIFGGSGSCSGVDNATWVLTGISTTPAWVQLSPSGTPPSARSGHSAVYDPADNVMTIFGGTYPELNDTWTLQAANGVGTPAWTQVTTSGGPPAGRHNHSAGYDASSKRMTIFGGSGSGPILLNDAWVLTQTPKISACVPPPPNLNLWLAFDETSGTSAADLSGHGNTAVLGGGAAFTSAGKVAGALDLSSGDGVVEVTANGAGLDYQDWQKQTIDFWLNWGGPFNSTNGRQYIWDDGQNTAYALVLIDDGTQQSAGIKAVGREAPPAFPEKQAIAPLPSIGVWEHYAFIFDKVNGQISIYKNAVLAAQVPWTPFSGISSGTKTIGVSVVQSAHFKGQIDEFEIKDDALSLSEIQAIFNAGSAGKCKAVCGNGTVESGEQCDDGNTSNGDCCSSSCQSETGSACPSDGNICTSDVCNASGVCAHPPAPNGTTCPDGNACTTNDVCTNGTCGSTAVTCTALDQCHDAGTCDPNTGTCSNPAKADGAACSDGSACTQADTCQAGVCTGGSPVNCNDGNVCTDDSCNPATGGCVHVNNTAACNDGNACTQTDTCQSGTCSGSNPKVCSALDQCHDAGTCDSGTGQCSNPSKADGTLCDDGVCTGGVCIGTSTNQPPVCTSATALPSTLWPPNHQLIPISIAGVTDPNGDPVTITATSVSQDEPVSATTGDGSGSTAPDAILSPLQVRAERNGTGDGRVYHISFTANDGKGGTCTGAVMVCVPHDQGKGKICVDGGPLYNSLVVP